MKRALRRVAVLGSTGSIGCQALDVVERLPGDLQVVALAAGKDHRTLEAQARKFRPSLVTLADPESALELERRLSGTGIEVAGGPEAATYAASHPEADLVLMAIVGSAGIAPSMAALQAGKLLALAGKETLVAAGALVTAAARDSGATIVPVDSEHSAIFQCLGASASEPSQLARLVLTASGGPFRSWDRGRLEDVTPEMALRHPNWSMGHKVTVDSATLMNKGLEVIEAHWLFGVDYPGIEVVIHPQSIVHSMVEFADGAVIAHMSVPDMRIPIQYALSFPDRLPSPAPRLSLTEAPPLTFELPNPEAFPCLRYAYEAGREGGTAPVVLSAADEVAVELFLRGEIGFLDIPRLVHTVLEKHEVVRSPDVLGILGADEWARCHAREVARKRLAGGKRTVIRI